MTELFLVLGVMVGTLVIVGVFILFMEYRDERRKTK